MAENDGIDLDQVVEDFISLDDLAGGGPSTKKPRNKGDSNEEVISLEGLTEEGGSKPKGAGQQKGAPGKSLGEIDSILKKEAPDLEENLNFLGKDLDESGQSFDPLDLRTALSDDSEQKLSRAGGLQKWLFSLPRKFKRGVINYSKILFILGTDLIFEGYLKTSKMVVHFVKVGHKDILSQLKIGIEKTTKKIGKVVGALLSLSIFDKILILSTPVLLWVAITLLQQTLKGGWMPATYEPYLESFNSVASKVYHIQPGETFEPFDSPLRHPEYIVLLDKIVVNLKRTRRSDMRPMGAFEFYIDGSSKETSIEIKNREREVLDIIQRDIEHFSYDELDTVEGKQKLKLMLRKKINEILNNGWVKRIYYKTIIIKP